MAREIHKLKAATVAAIDEAGLYADGLGLYLQVDQSGNKSWIFRYQMNGGRQRYMGLGSVADFTLKEARERAAHARKLKADNIDPIQHRRDARKQAATEREQSALAHQTFKQAAEDWYESKKAEWSNARYINQFETAMKHHVYPKIGKLPVSDVSTDNILSVVKPIWLRQNKTANRIRGWIESVLSYATVRKLRAGDNPARWRGHLDHLLPKPARVAPVVNHPALPHGEIPSFMRDLRAIAGIPARALEFIVLTAVRTNEAIGARWVEFDLDAATWTIPAERMKARRDQRKEHRVPLSPRAVEILRQLPREQGGHVFIGARKGKPIGKMAMPNLLAEMGRVDVSGRGVTIHGFRSTFRDWVADETEFPDSIAEACLAHKLATGVEAAYKRTTMFRKRSELMNAWSEYCCQPPRDADVVPFTPRIAAGA
ncbi:MULTISPECIES: tyrosine-type recombinase/integrase [unclassified Bradyrhizobium]|uniref:tyrosine-type recombinase/integrase n=1 Tax=unclassified Bradyrhizobium TaxID=2631580 RepID=UPI0028E2FE4C|nr:MULTISPECIES: integrase arm-type DNA-binding domain-containing protein [unclassified Bradyrhizobium]